MLCPFCREQAFVKAIYDDPDGSHLGCELMDMGCPNDHEWTRPTTRSIVRSIGWGHMWRERGKQIEEDGDDS